MNVENGKNWPVVSFMDSHVTEIFIEEDWR